MTDDFFQKLRGWGDELLDPEKRIRPGIKGALESIDMEQQRAASELRGVLGMEYTIDEMAVYFGDLENLYAFLNVMVGLDGWVLFNQADDVVHTRPISSAYRVRYWFLDHPNRNYRLEIMYVAEGHSPYHFTLEDFAIAHASFKVPTMEAYGKAMVALRGVGYEPLQHCESSYGRFSYMCMPHGRGHVVPIKPRMNTRDVAKGIGGDSSGN